MSRKYVIAGNWKMNKTSEEGAELAKDIVLAVGQQAEVEVVVCPPFTLLESVSKVLEGSNIKLGGQNMHPAVSGAYTGEISAEMLRNHFSSYVILGHSERRAYFDETDNFVNQKVKVALENQLRPILCVGETLEEREAEKTLDVVKTQLVDGLVGVSAEQTGSVVIAYEPVWAIGTGKVATPEEAQVVHAFIRQTLAELYDSAHADKIRILYGGSMKASNARELLAQEDIDGGLIGGAALESNSFIDLVKVAIDQD
ncbi:MAG: triose-phosphate isomerase [Opitutaceae bacterium]|nr:triose-phosphate isomerase [Opitutaceae bacterium]